MHFPSTRMYAVLRLMRIFSTIFALVPYSACSMAFVASGFGLTGSGYDGWNNLLFLIDVLTSLPPLRFVLRYAFVRRRHSENRPHSFPFLQSHFTCSAFSALLFPEKASLQTVFPLPNPFPILFASDDAFSAFLTSNLPIFKGV